jgi:hypothetical protein
MSLVSWRMGLASRVPLDMPAASRQAIGNNAPLTRNDRTMSTLSLRRSGASVLLFALGAAALPGQATIPAQWSQWVPDIKIQHLRPRDERGVNIFEPPKRDSVSVSGFTIQWGAAFTQEFQGLRHGNTAAPRVVNNVDQNQLIQIGNGFNNAVANLYLDAQIAPGIRVALTSYLSSRHHEEAWVKDGYIQVDASPIDNELLNEIMKYVTLKVGHFEINYGDEHFRRADNGQAMYDPLVGHYILDAFTTEVGEEVYLRHGPWLAMSSITGGEVHGQVTAPGRRTASFIEKLGFDHQLTPEVRLRLTGSAYANWRAASSTLYTGDRGGSPYYDVLENLASNEQDQAWSGQIRPGFANAVHAYVMNPFIKIQNLELFGNIETATGKADAELRKRTLRQQATDVVYRLWQNRLYGAVRYNRVQGQLPGIANDVTVDRTELGGGWFVTPIILAKAEYVWQRYHDFPVTDIRNGGKFDGFMVTGTVAF